VLIDKEDDPEHPAQYFMVSTPAAGTIEDLVAKIECRHRAVREVLCDRINDYRLIVDPQ